MDHTDNAFVGAGHEHASVWDNGADLVEGLAHALEVRRLGLEAFGPGAVRSEGYTKPARGARSRLPVRAVAVYNSPLAPCGHGAARTSITA